MAVWTNDGSIEILADGAIGPFGFGMPRIAALVKAGTDIANPDLDELEVFISRSGARNGLFVSLIGFTETAQREAGRLFHQTKFWDVMHVVGALKSNYEKLSPKFRTDFRLKPIWVLDH